MQEGFDMLEDKQFSAAENYFEEYISIHDKTARICHGRAVGLGGDAARALQLFTLLAKDYPDDIEVQLNLGEAFLWNEKTAEAITIYEHILVSQPVNFVANLGLANAYASESNNDLALEYINAALVIDSTNNGAKVSHKFIMVAKAYELYKNGQFGKSIFWLNKVQQIDPHNNNAQEIKELIREKSKTNISTYYNQSKDQGKNTSISKGLHIDYKFTDRHKISFDAGIHNSHFDNSRSAKQQSIFISDQILLNKTFNLEFGAGINASRSKEFTMDRSLLKAGLEMFISDRLYSKLQYQNEVHNYTVDLIESDILMRHYSFATNYTITPQLALYGNAVYSSQSDENARRLIYGSLYYSLVKDPVVRLGMSYNWFRFDEQRSNYFSPESYRLAECFMLIDNNESPALLKYKLQVSFGNQKIESQKQQAVSRIEASLGYKFKNGMYLSANYLRSTAAAATAIGEYSFQQWSLLAGYRF